jgi:hypothetical protein
VADGEGRLGHAAAATSIRFSDGDCERHRRERKRHWLFGGQHLFHDYGHIANWKQGLTKGGEADATQARAWCALVQEGGGGGGGERRR